MVLTIVPSVSLASTVTNKQTYVETKSMQLMDDGLSAEDATYYAELDYMVKDLEQKGQVIEIDESIPDMSDEEVIADIKAFRQKVLSGDKKAIKKALKSTAKMYQDGSQKMEKFIKDNPNKSKYELVYPDGSKITFFPGTVEKLSDDLVNPSGYKEAYMSTNNLSTGSWRISNVAWQFVSGISYAKIALVYSDHTVNTGSRYHEIIGALSGASSAGVVLAQTSNAEITRAVNNNSLGLPAEVVAQANMSLSGSFSASYLTLSVSLNAGLGWTQYVFTRGYGDGVTGHYAAEFF